MLLDRSQTTVTDSTSIIKFETDENNGDRYLTIDGKRTIYMGTFCSTCAYFFSRLEGSNKAVEAEDVVDQLNNGMARLDLSMVDALKKIMPDGRYEILLQRIHPKLIRPGEKGDYFSEGIKSPTRTKNTIVYRPVSWLQLQVSTNS